jgi:hypothetical protein
MKTLQGNPIVAVENLKQVAIVFFEVKPCTGIGPFLV